MSPFPRTLTTKKNTTTTTTSIRPRSISQHQTSINRTPLSTPILPPRPRLSSIPKQTNSLTPALQPTPANKSTSNLNGSISTTKSTNQLLAPHNSSYADLSNNAYFNFAYTIPNQFSNRAFNYPTYLTQYPTYQYSQFQPNQPYPQQTYQQPRFNIQYFDKI